MKKILKIVAWNANGLVNHIHELKIFLFTEEIDICLISESHNTSQTFINIRGYKIYNANHPSNLARGGVTIFVRENIKHYEHSKIEKEQMQVATISLQINNKNCNMSAIYCPPRYNLKSIDFVELFQTLGPCFILGGDLNAKNVFWGSRLNSPKGKELLKAGRLMKCNFHSGNRPTYWPTDTLKLPDLIDFFISKGINKDHILIQNSDDLSSDHSPVIMTLTEYVIVKPQPPTLTNHNTNWDSFRFYVNASICLNVSLKTPYEIEKELDNLIECIQAASWKSMQINNETVRKSCSAETKKLIIEKRKARKKWQKHRTAENKNKVNQLTNKIKSLLKATENAALTNRLKNLTATKDTEFSLWKTTKEFFKSSQTIPPIKKADNTWAKSPIEKANLFADHLENTFKPFPNLTSDENIVRITKYDSRSIPRITRNELISVITNDIKSHKAPGYDLITGKILKELPENGVRKLLYIINASLRLRYVPNQWKVAEVIMIPKPGKQPNDRKSYRPISLLPTMSKVFEKLILKRLIPILVGRNLIPTHQFGFRSKHSTIEQVHRVSNIIEKALNEKKICSGILIDVAQAFDKVWHDGLNFKLHRDLPEEYSKLLESYITERYFRVKHEEEYSTIRKIEAGVPQGSVLGPTLYILFTRDIPTPPDTKIATFADDTVVLVTGKSISETTNKLQIATDCILHWTKKWRIQLNESKSTHINFTYKNITPQHIYMNNNIIPYANTAKYLGFTLDAKLKWKEHVKKKVNELKLNLRKMYWLFSPKSKITIENKLLLYQQILKPKWTYGIQLWGCTAKTNIKLIQTFQNKVLRLITDSPWYIRNDDIHRDLNITTVSDEIAISAKRHAQRLLQHTNEELRDVIRNPMQQRRLRRTLPTDLYLMNA